MFILAKANKHYTVWLPPASSAYTLVLTALPGVLGEGRQNYRFLSASIMATYVHLSLLRLEL